MIIDGFSFGIGSVVGFFGALLITFILYWIFKNALEQKRASIDTTVAALDEKLEKMDKTVRDFERDRDKKYGALEQSLSLLNISTGKLGNLLNNSQKRGAWGEYIADNILTSFGFKEGRDYFKQKTQGGGRPDFTFELPNGLSINMDVKFSLENYAAYIDAKSEIEKETHKRNFIKDIESTIKDISTRDYITEKTLDFVLVFIPNEATYQFLHECDANIIERSLEKYKVILCSPVTLCTVLIIIKQATQSFKLEQSAKELLNTIYNFGKEWKKYIKEMEALKSSLNKAQENYDHLVGLRQTTLKNSLDKVNGLLEANGFPLLEE